MKEEYAKYLLDKTKSDYNLISEDFSRTRKKEWEELKPILDRFVKKGDRVLDLGSGNGRYYNYFKEKETKYVGIDNSERLVEIARKKYLFADFRLGDGLNLPFPDNSFDKVVSVAVFHHVPSENFRLRFLKEINRVLKKEGKLILTVWKFHREREKKLLFKSNLLRLLRISKMDKGDIFNPWEKKTKRYYHSFSEKELINITKKAGFKKEEIGIIENEKGNRKNIYFIGGLAEW